ncbi:MAG: hypothetical protein HW383_437 [Candidatus Magasanikbacteria bacterium]|nr:hypothetical protein [Candidatus Magasanikbacteria bacterium]
MDWGAYFMGGLLILAAFFLLFPLFILGGIGIAIFIALIILGLILIGRRFFLWYRNAFAITNERIIDFDQRGFFERVVSESTLEKIQDVSFHFHGFWQTSLHYGDVNVQTAWGSVNLKIPCVRRPERVQRLVLDLCKQFMADPASGESRQTLVSMVQQLEKLKVTEREALKNVLEERMEMEDGDQKMEDGR